MRSEWLIAFLGVLTAGCIQTTSQCAATEEAVHQERSGNQDPETAPELNAAEDQENTKGGKPTPDAKPRTPASPALPGVPQ